MEISLEWQLLRDARKIAVVARSERTCRPWYEVASYLIDVGYEVYLVNPLLDEALGRFCYDRIQDLPVSVDVVDVFRRIPEVDEVAQDAIDSKARAFWMQTGIINQQALAQARDAGLQVVMDSCTKVEHARMVLFESSVRLNNMRNR